MVVFTGFSFRPAHEDLGLLLPCGSNPGRSRGVDAAIPVRESLTRALAGEAGNLVFNSFSVGRVSYVLSEYSKCLGTTKAGRSRALIRESPIQLFQVAPAGIFF